MATNLEKAKVGALGFISVGVLVALILSILTLVKVNQDHNGGADIVTTTTTTEAAITPTTPTDATTPKDPPTEPPVPPPEPTEPTDPPTVPPTEPPLPPPNPPKNPGLHIRPRKKIQPDLDNLQKFGAYAAYAKMLKEGLNTTYDPCDNFYEYACGNFQQDMDFTTIQWKNTAALLKGLKKENKAEYAVKTKVVFDECVRQQKDPKYVHQDGQTVLQIFQAFEDLDQYSFPALQIGNEPNNIQHFLGVFLGLIKRELDLSIFVTSDVNTNWKRPQAAPGTHKKTYLLHLDQPTLTYDDIDYHVALNKTETKFKTNALKTVKHLAELKNISIDEAKLEDDIDHAWELEKFIAYNINVGAEEKRKYERSYNIFTAKSANTEFNLIDFPSYLITLAAQSNSSFLVRDPSFEFNVNEPKAYRELGKYLNFKTAKRDLMNYINIRVLISIKGLFPPNTNSSLDEDEEEEVKGQVPHGFNIGFNRNNRRRPMPFPLPKPSPWPTPGSEASIAVDRTELVCALRTSFKLSASTTRIYMDEVLPKEKRGKVKSKVALLVNNVIEGFQYQLDRLDWMTPETKVHAYEKISYLVKNLVYPEWVEDDAALNEYYRDLVLDGTEDYLEFSSNLKKFDLVKQLDLLSSEESVERDDYLMSMSIVNAWYQPEVNSITIPYGILQAPFFHIDYPMAANLGAIGVIAGHELTHGFDDEGTQYDGVGALRTWMDPKSLKSFDDMAKCVIGQYGSFEPFPGLHLDGSNTQGENIADNGGLRAAFNALAAYEAFYGPDPALPDKRLSGFTNQQIFFMSFARAWCEIPGDLEDMEEQIRTDPHSPSKYRVLGSIQNFPAFRDAFNCPVQTEYAPEKHCNVWASEVNDQNGVPDTPEANANIGIDPLKPNTTESFNAVGNRVASNVNLDQDPCERFYEYSCRKEVRKPLEEAEVVVDEAVEKFLATTEQNDEATKNAKRFLHACSIATADGTGIAEAIKEIEGILGVKVNFTSDTYHTIKSENLIALAYLFSQRYDIDLFFHLNLRPNLKKQLNTAPYLLYLEQPELLLKLETYDSARAEEILKKFTAYSSNLVKTYYNTGEDVSENVEEALAIEGQFAKWLYDNNEVTEDRYEAKSIAELTQQYPNLHLDEYFTFIKGTEGRVLRGVNQYLEDHRTRIVNAVPDVLTRFNEFTATLRGKKARDLVRYIALKVMLKMQRFVPRENAEIDGEVGGWLDQEIFAKPTTGNKCLKELHHFMPIQYTSAAALGLYKDEKDLQAHQHEVAKIIDYVFIEFERQLEGIAWMPLSSRRKAIQKVRAVARNVGVPYTGKVDPFELIEKDALREITRRADGEDDDDDDPDLATEWYNANLLKRLIMFSKLVNTKDISRDLFIDYYQRRATPAAQHSQDLNSISISLAALQSPFYNKDYPMAWNFATVGSLVAEQLARLFDETGLEHDEFGQLRQWIDVESGDLIKNQLADLEKQYAKLGLGGITKSEILGKILGAALSYRALVRWNEFNGEQGALAHPVFKNYNSEQLFFVLYSQQSCSNEAYANISLANSLINSGNFPHVFHCSANSFYGRKKRVALYETEVDGSLGVPNVPQRSPDLNIPKPTPEYSEKYKEAAKAFEDSVDISADPCADFYQYTCGNYPGDSPFSDAGTQNTLRLLDGLTGSIEEEDPKAISLEKLLFAQCKLDLPRFDELNSDAKVLKAVVEDLEGILGQKFPLSTQDNNATALTPQQIGKAMGFLGGKHGIGALLDSLIYTNVRAPEKGYSIYLDSGYYLLRNVIAEPEEEVVGMIRDNILSYLNVVMKVTNETIDNIEEEARAFMMIEGLLMDSDNPGRRNRRNASETYTQITLGELIETSPKAIDLRSFMEGQVVEIPEALAKVSSDEFDVGLLDPQNLQSFLEAFEELMKNEDLKPQNLVNYLFYHVIMYKGGSFLPPLPEDSLVKGIRKPKDIAKKLVWERKLPKTEETIRYPEPETPIEKNRKFLAAGYTQLDVQCMNIITGFMQEATNALFVDVTYPEKEKRLEKRLAVAKFADSIMVGFRTMLDQLNWMKPESKTTAYKKIDLLVKNIAYPNMSVDYNLLEDYHKELIESDVVDHSLPHALHTLLKFNMKQAVKELLKPVFDRTTFGAAYKINAWYQPAANSITLPAAILQQPFYDPEWPDSINYGGIGVVAGHELVHGFDDSGVQWDPVGRLQGWFDDESQEKFNEMADCVVKQYGKFCYPDGRCVDGFNTQGENIADNGGIQAAYRAYRSAVGVNGPHAGLPSDLIGKFTFDQLFFLSFGRTWCNGPISSQGLDRILRDVHSPPAFRVFGTLQNFPAFRDAFNCPLKAPYAPEEHCQVWITDIEPSLAIPTPIPSKNVEFHFKNIKKNHTEILV